MDLSLKCYEEDKLLGRRFPGIIYVTRWRRTKHAFSFEVKIFVPALKNRLKKTGGDKKRTKNKPKSTFPSSFRPVVSADANFSAKRGCDLHEKLRWKTAFDEKTHFRITEFMMLKKRRNVFNIFQFSLSLCFEITSMTWRGNKYRKRKTCISGTAELYLKIKKGNYTARCQSVKLHKKCCRYEHDARHVCNIVSPRHRRNEKMHLVKNYKKYREKCAIRFCFTLRCEVPRNILRNDLKI